MTSRADRMRAQLFSPVNTIGADRVRILGRVASSPCRLAFGAIFWFHRPVSAAPHEVTSTPASDASRQHHGVAFTTTHWSVVLEAQGESPAAQEALEKLCRTYWRTIFA